MKHLEESNKEAKEELAELEAEMELENRLQAEEMASRSPQLNPLAPRLDRSSSGGSPWRSTGGGDREQDREGPVDSPTADITRDSINIRAEPPSCLELPMEVMNHFFHVAYVACCLECNLVVILKAFIHHGSLIPLLLC